MLRPRNRTFYWQSSHGSLVLLCQDCAAYHRERGLHLVQHGCAVSNPNRCIRCRARGRKSPQLPELP